ncbi:hypothetical protein IV203_027413 [Nitzschia inconspicua]|uniref:Uncharacterized protein n=1 Tax=Nitzschia inconspicua TaxID=303405 RepID=A0A9K3LX05_9STRA|nr:hypothetical protein IV203_027413 [Nitzschia inconspicua]
MSDHEEEELDGVVAPGAARRKASKIALRRSALVDSDDNDDDDDDDENLFADSDDDENENDKGIGSEKKENNKKTFADDDDDSAATSQGWEKYKNALETLKEFIVEQPGIDGDSSSSQGLQPFDLDANVELLEEQGPGSDLQAIDDAISKIANSRKWSFHKDMLLEYLTNKGDIMSLESRMLVGIIARQILVRSKSENPPNKAVAQELFVKLKGDSDKSNSIAFYVTSKWPKHFFEEVETNIPSQPDKDLRIHIIKVGLGFVHNAFVIDTAKKVDLLKSRNLLWADFSQQAYQWAFENKTNGTTRIMEVAENAKNHLQTIGATFSGIETSTPSISDNKSNAKEDHVLKDEEELKRIEAQKSEERRAAMRSKMRRGSNLANAPVPSTAVPSSRGVSASAGAPTIPNRPSMATTPSSGISYQSMSTAEQEYSSGSQHTTHKSFPGHTVPPPTATSGFFDPNSGGFAQEYNASSYQETSAPFAVPDAQNGPADFKAAGTSRWGNNRRQDQNHDPQNQARRYNRDERPEARPPILEDVSRPFYSGRGQSTLSEVPLIKPSFDEHRTQRPPLRDDEPRKMMSTPKVPQPRRGMEELRSQRPSLHDANGGVFVADVSQESASRVYQARPGHEERVALRPPLNEDEGRPRSFVDDSNYSAYDAVTSSREYNSVSGYENRYEQEESGRPPREPPRYTNPNQSSSYPSQGTGNKRSRGGGSYQRNTRQRSDSPSFSDGRGRGRGLDMTKPAWMTEPSGPVGVPDGNNFHSSGSNNGAALVDSSASGGGGRGRGRHQTAPAWMTRNQQDQTTMGIGPLPPSGGGRGIHQTQPAWMTQQQQQQQGGPTGRPDGPIGSSDGGAGRGRGRGLTLPAWVTQQQQQ